MTRTIKTTLLLTLFLPIFFISVADAYSKPAPRSFLHIVSQKNDFEFYKIKSFLVNTESFVYNVLGKPPAGRCNIYLKSNFEMKIKKTKGNVLNIYLNDDYLSLVNSKKVSRNLLSAFILFSLARPYTKSNIENIAWLVDALNRKSNRLTFPRFYPPEGAFPGMHNLLMSNYTLRPDTIIMKTVPPKEKLIYAFNSEASEILLNSILSLKNGRNFLNEYLKELCSNGKKNNMHIFYSVLAKNLRLTQEKSKKLFIKHLNNTAFRLSINSFMPASTQYVSNVFDSACIVSYNPKNNPNIIKNCSLENLSKVWNNIDAPEKLIQNLQVKFRNLRNYSPFLLQKPINKF